MIPELFGAAAGLFILYTYLKEKKEEREEEANGEKNRRRTKTRKGTKD